MWRASKGGDAWNHLQVFGSCCVLSMIVLALYGRKRRLRQWVFCFRVSHVLNFSSKVSSNLIKISCIKLLQICRPARRLRSQLEQRADEVLQVHCSEVCKVHCSMFFSCQILCAVMEASQCIAAELKAEAGWNNVKIALIGPHLELAWKSSQAFAIHRRREEMSRMERFEICRCRWNWRRFEKICQNPRKFKSNRGVWYSGLVTLVTLNEISDYWN